MLHLRGPGLPSHFAAEITPLVPPIGISPPLFLEGSKKAIKPRCRSKSRVKAGLPAGFINSTRTPPKSQLGGSSGLPPLKSHWPSILALGFELSQLIVKL